MSIAQVRWLAPATGILASVVLHAGVAAVVFTPWDKSASSTDASDMMPQPDPENRTQLGVERSDTVTISWIGFEDPTPHRAIAAEVDQAQVMPAAGQIWREAFEAAPATAEAATEALQVAIEAASTRLRQTAERVELAASRAEQQRALREAAERARAASEARQAEQPQTASAPGEQGIVDDREAQATSTDRTLSYTMGQPVARQGLRIQTVIPRFDATTRLTDLRSLRRKPVVAVTFGRDGSVVDAQIKPGTASGRSSVDEPILNAVFRWRATGSDLESIPADDAEAGITVEIRFDF